MCYKDPPPDPEKQGNLQEPPEVVAQLFASISPSPLPHAPRPPHPAQHLLILSSYSRRKDGPDPFNWSDFLSFHLPGLPSIFMLQLPSYKSPN